jgi:hypothetical protein
MSMSGRPIGPPVLLDEDDAASPVEEDDASSPVDELDDASVVVDSLVGGSVVELVDEPVVSSPVVPPPPPLSAQPTVATSHTAAIARIFTEPECRAGSGVAIPRARSGCYR